MTNDIEFDVPLVSIQFEIECTTCTRDSLVGSLFFLFLLLW